MKMYFLKAVICFIYLLGSAEASEKFEFLDNIIDHYVPRSKRETIEKKLSDPIGCIEKCVSTESESVRNASSANTARLVALGMDEAKKLTRKHEEEIKKHITELTIKNMGPYFDDLCQVAKKTEACFKRCPKSQLREIILADYNSPAVYCEPGNNWPSFQEYYMGVACYNQTLIAKPCDAKCGKEQNISASTRLELHTFTIRYDTDAERNTKAARDACKSMLCHIDCYEPIIVDKCGVKAMDTYRRMVRLEPGSALAILQKLNVIDSDIIECNEFYKNQ